MSVVRGLTNRINYTKSLEAGQQTAAANGSTVDLADAGSAAFIADCGVAGGTSPSFTFVIQHAPDDGTGSPGTWADVTDDDLEGGSATIPAVTSTADQIVIERGYKGGNRFVRWRIDAVSGTSPTLEVSAGVVVGDLRRTINTP